MPLSDSPSLHSGVYRSVRQHPTTWVYVSATPDSHTTQVRLLDPQNLDHRWVALWLEVSRQCSLRLRYDPTAKTLAIPDLRVPLPVLVDRALRLVSGTCPTLVMHRVQRYLVFANIGRRRASQAARVLSLPLETVHG